MSVSNALRAAETLADSHKHLLVKSNTPEGIDRGDTEAYH